MALVVDTYSFLKGESFSGYFVPTFCLTLDLGLLNTPLML
jgi:hypothetical protein